MRIRHLRIEQADLLGFADGEYYEEVYENMAKARCLDLGDANPGYEKRIKK